MVQNEFLVKEKGGKIYLSQNLISIALKMNK